MNVTENKKTSYAVVVVFSNWALRQLCMFLEDELGARQEQIGVMRIDRAKGKETNRTIMLVERSLLDTAEKKGFTTQQRGVDFKMTEYEVRDHNKPKDGFTRNFFVPLPEKISASDAQAQLENKLDVFCNFGLFEKNRPRLKIPLESRESEKHRGRAFVTFARETGDEQIALARILLHDTRLYTSESDYELMKCFWAKERTPLSSPRPGEKKVNAVEKKGKNGKLAPKNPRKRAPVKKGVERDAAPSTKQGRVPALEPGENKWNKTLSGVTPVPNVSSAAPADTTAPVTETTATVPTTPVTETTATVPTTTTTTTTTTVPPTTTTTTVPTTTTTTTVPPTTTTTTTTTVPPTPVTETTATVPPTGLDFPPLN